jgi:hypothetical protein
MLDQLGRKAVLASVLLPVPTRGTPCRERLAYAWLIGRKNPLSSMCSRQ